VLLESLFCDQFYYSRLFQFIEEIFNLLYFVSHFAVILAGFFRAACGKLYLMRMSELATNEHLTLTKSHSYLWPDLSVMLGYFSGNRRQLKLNKYAGASRA
jgi:hypothetical protein